MQGELNLNFYWIDPFHVLQYLYGKKSMEKNLTF